MIHTHIPIYSNIYRAFNCMPYLRGWCGGTRGCIPGGVLRTWKMEFCHLEALRGRRLLRTHLGTVCRYALFYHRPACEGLRIRCQFLVCLPAFSLWLWFDSLSCPQHCFPCLFLSTSLVWHCCLRCSTAKISYAGP